MRNEICFLSICLVSISGQILWQFHKTEREIDDTLQVLKTDCDLRTVYHKKDESMIVHMYFGLEEYWVVNVIS